MTATLIATPDPEPFWDRLERLGRLTGHLVAKCPACGERQMIGYISASATRPKCKVCVDPPRVIVLSDPKLVIHKNPGEPFKPTIKVRLLREGLIKIVDLDPGKRFCD